MKKIIRKVKGKKVLSLVLAAIMLATTFNIALPQLKLDASAAANIGGISQERVVSDYATKYPQYVKDFLTTAEGISCGEPTDIVIPGLKAAYQDDSTNIDYNDFVIQGLSYYPVRDWIMVSAYHNDGLLPSMIFALSAKTGVFEAAFEICNKGGTPNYDHGGGLAFSQYNFYYSGDDTDKDEETSNGDAAQIAYAPLSYFDNPKDTDGDKFYEIELQGAINLPEMGNAATAYVCYDEGILWAGNFYSDGIGAGNYNGKVVDEFNHNGNVLGNSMIYGYKLAGNSSAEEWAYLCGKYNNLLEVSTASGTGESGGSTLTWNAYKKSDSVNIYGNITAPTAYVGEYTPDFGSVILTEGVNYTIEFTSTNNKTDMYMFRQNASGGKGPHTNVKQSSQTTITKLEDGRYHYRMEFTAGTAPASADSTWDDNPGYDYTGAYTVRFDQDAINAGESRKFEITDIRIYQTNNHSTKRVFNVGSAGYPSYCVAVHTDFEEIQYAIVDKGRIYLSRSWGTGKNDETVAGAVGSVASLDDYSTLSIADIDLSVPGDVTYTHKTVNGGTRTTTAYLLGHENTEHWDLMPMSEGLCFIEDNLYISFEGASNKYLNEYEWHIDISNLASSVSKTGNCDYPIDVVWKLDPYALRSEKRPNTDKTDYYEKITSLSQIQTGDEFIIVHESEEEDPVTQMPILYAFDADGGFKDYNLAKSVSGSVKGYDGMVCHPLTKYSREGNRIYLTEPETDDRESIRWKLDKISGNNYNIENTELYFSTYKNLYFDANTISMMPDNASELANIRIHEVGNGGFWFEGNNNFLWCNDSLTNNYTPKINRHYAENGGSRPMYSGLSEKKGTVHCNALFNGGSNIIDGPIETGEPYYEDGVFHIYKRVLDQYAEQQESRVFTDMSAVVESDGTYTVNLETYAISSTQYKVLDERPTDFIIVMDASASMEKNSDTGMTGWKRYSSLNTLSLESAAGSEGPAKTYDKEYSGNIYYRHTDGQYCKLKCMTHYVKKSGLTTYIKVKLWYTAADGNNYYLMSNGTVRTTEPSWDECVEISGNSGPSRAGKTIYTGPHYEQTTLTRLDAMKLSVDSLIDKIVTEANISGLKHRVSIVQYGSGSDESYYNTGLYKTNTNFVQYSGSGTISATDYASTFFDVTDSSSVAKLKYQVLDRVESPTSKDADTFANHGFEMAKNIISNSDSSYTATGNRSVCVLMITDGVPGKGSNDSTSANNTANEAIAQAKTIKDAGGYVFTAQLGSNSMSGFDMDKYMDYTSSEYVNAISLDNSGDRNIKDIEYRKDFALGGSFNLTNFVSTMFDAIQANSRFALVQLDGNSVIQQKLSSLFDASTAEKPTAVVQDGYYDSIGRLTFDNIQTDKDIESNMSADTITVSGFDYSTEYISKEKPGKKLIVTVKGLIPKSDVDFLNESINNHTYTAIYQKPEDVGATSSERDLAFKHFPTEYFNIPEYTYVMDYGMKMLDTDINGTLCSVSDTLSRQSTYSNTSANGALEITNSNLDLLYQLSSDKAQESGYTLIKRDDGTYDWFKIKLVPASNVLYEESAITIADDGVAYHWDKVGDPTITTQDLSTEEDVYGFDNHYASSTGFSNGTHYYSTVNASKKFSDAATVTFKGNGFDLLSACGPNTGVQTVSLKRVNEDGTTAFVQGFIVDTYLNAGNELLDSADGLVYQVPIVKWEGAYDTYIVESKAYYLKGGGAVKNHGKTNVIKNSLIDTGLVMNTAEFDSNTEIEKILEAEGWDKDKVELIWFDDNSVLNGGTGVAAQKNGSRAKVDKDNNIYLENYIDGFRVYNPLQDTSSYIESERNAQYVNVLNNLANGTLSDGSLDFESGNIAFITGSLTSTDENGNEVKENLSFANYNKFGPSDELYLKGGATDGVVFKTPVAPGGRVMVSLRSANGVATTAKIYDKVFTINGATEMYYDITDLLPVDADGKATVSIINTGEGILAVNNIKLTNTVASAGLMMLSMDDIETVQYYASMEPVQATVENGVVTPVEEEEEIPEDNTNTDNDNTNTEESEKEEFSIFSIIEMLIAFIEKILYNAFGAGSIA